VILGRTLSLVLFVVALLLLAALAYSGIAGGLDQWSQEMTRGQRLQTITQFLYGGLSVVVIVTAFTWKRAARAAQMTWAIALALAGGLASVVWGETSVLIGVVSGAAALLVALGILWLLRRV
jgi:hypothetical protein